MPWHVMVPSHRHIHSWADITNETVDALVPKWCQANSCYCSQINKFNNVLIASDALTSKSARPPVGAGYQISNVTACVLALGRARPSARTVLFHIVCHVLEAVNVLAPHGARPSVYKEREL